MVNCQISRNQELHRKTLFVQSEIQIYRELNTYTHTAFLISKQSQRNHLCGLTTDAWLIISISNTDLEVDLNLRTVKNLIGTLTESNQIQILRHKLSIALDQAVCNEIIPKPQFARSHYTRLWFIQNHHITPDPSRISCVVLLNMAFESSSPSASISGSSSNVSAAKRA